MADARITVRLPSDELRRLEARADALRLSKADVVRLGLTSLDGADRSASQLAEISDALRADVARISDQNRRTATLLLLVLKAPQEAQKTLDEIFKD